MIKINHSIYAAAQQMIECGTWTVDRGRGVVLKADTGKPVTASLNSCGYLQLRFRFESKDICPFAHRVIWESANGPIPTGLFVNHIDGVKTNNALSNLELVTHSRNALHAYEIGLHKPIVGDAAPWAKLTAEQVRAICSRALRGEKQAAIGADYGISKSKVNDIKAGRAWAATTADIRRAGVAR